MNLDKDDKQTSGPSAENESLAPADTPQIAAENGETSPDPQTAEPRPTRAADVLVRFGKAAWAYIRHAKIELIVLAAILVLDLVTKALVGHFMDVGQSIEVIPQFLYMTYVRNTKAAFGSAFGLEKVLGDAAIRIIFLIITVIALGVFSYILYRCRKRHILMRVAIAMIIAGALGNFVDRLVFRYVRDFVEILFFGCDLPLFGTSFAIFNIADVGLTVGVVLFLVYFIAIYKEPKKAAPAAAATQGETAQEETAPKPAAETSTENTNEAVAQNSAENRNETAVKDVTEDANEPTAKDAAEDRHD